ncbi:MAG: D-alanyl-D-alanine carboxypeptidase [Candidatus Kerfeldbacteria bacterium]|nr:D-alanyl-D-alanine carboxypeptidase [Candidatus Kerfeldbacteria bacterium]
MPRHCSTLLFIFTTALVGASIIYTPQAATAAAAPGKNQNYQDFSAWYVDTYQLKALPFRAAAVIDADTLTPLYFHQEATVMPTASLMKLLTVSALLSYPHDWYSRASLSAAENEDLLRPYVGPKDVFSLLKLEPDDTITLEQALAATLIGSANNTAVALDKFIGVAREQFIERMKQVAQQWGLKNTTVDEPSGLSLANTSTAYDLTQAACQDFQDFVVSFYAASSQVKFTTGQGVVKTILHTVHDLRQNQERYFGAKTGYLDETMFHLAAGYITPQGHRVCLTILSSPTRAESENTARALGVWVDQMYHWRQE